MTVKTLAYSAQQHLEANIGTRFKRAHIYELLAASFGFKSWASLGADAVLTEAAISSRRASFNTVLVQNRCIEIGYTPETAKTISIALDGFLSEHEIGVIRIADLVAHLRSEWGGYHGSDDKFDEREYDSDDEFDEREYDSDDEFDEGEYDSDDEFDEGEYDSDDEFDEGEYVADDQWTSTEALVSPILLDGLNAAAGKRNLLAHYALVLIYAPGDDEDDEQAIGSEYWYQKAQLGHVLSGAKKEWADAWVWNRTRSEKYEYHLREASRLGRQNASQSQAAQLGDPSIFEQTEDLTNAYPALLADIDNRLGLPPDERKWLTAAAQAGNSEAMRKLIKEYDYADLQRCWTWIYLAELVGADLTKDECDAIDENGDPYDDEGGGPIFAACRDGIKLAPIGAEPEADARRAAQEIFQRIA